MIAGSARRDNTAVFVSRGVGTVYVPVRIGCPPEVAVLTLRRRAVCQRYLRGSDTDIETTVPSRRRGRRRRRAAGRVDRCARRGADADGTSRKIRHASVRASGMGFADISSFAKHPAFDLVAVADVDLCIARVQQLFPKVRVYQHWREMLKREKNTIDSVNISTPDHMHAPIAMEAMRLGKHVYVQKPMTATIAEARRGIRPAPAWSRKWASRPVRRFRSGSERPWCGAGWLAGYGRCVFSNKSWGDEGLLPDGSDPVPPTLDWDAWVGVAAMRPYLRAKFHPGEWRRRRTGTGTLGDMGCHIFSPSYRASA